MRWRHKGGPAYTHYSDELGHSELTGLRIVHIVIVGNGIAGITVARFVRKGSRARITVVSSESPFHIARTALMYAFMGDIRREDLKPYEDQFWPENGIDLIHDHVEDVDTELRRIRLASGAHLNWDELVLATGSRPNRFGWPGEHTAGVQGLYSMQDLDSMERWTHDCSQAAVVGGGLIGIEMAEMLRVRGVDVHFLVRERAYMDFTFDAQESALIHAQIERHGVRLHLGVELDRIETDEAGRARSVVTTSGDAYDASFVGLAVGVHPNAELARKAGVDVERGILVDDAFNTSVPGIRAVGDCAQFRDGLSHGRSIEQLWYSGRRQGRILGRILAGEELTYKPALFYNSAKFFDLEYQTYGDVPPSDTDDVMTRSWTGEGRHVRFAWSRANNQLVGMNGFNVRIRHETAGQLVRSAHSGSISSDIMRSLLFDPEFSKLPVAHVAGAVSP